MNNSRTLNEVLNILTWKFYYIDYKYQYYIQSSTCYLYLRVEFLIICWLSVSYLYFNYVLVFVVVIKAKAHLLLWTLKHEMSLNAYIIQTLTACKSYIYVRVLNQANSSPYNIYIIGYKAISLLCAYMTCLHGKSKQYICLAFRIR